MSLIVKYREGKSIPEGIYVAKLVSVVEQPETNPKWGPGIRWEFEILQGEHAGTSVTGMCSQKVSPKSKLWAWLHAFGYAITPGEGIDVESLVGTVVRIKTLNKGSVKIIDGKKVEMTFSNVEAIAPYKGPAVTAGADKNQAPPKPEAPTPEPVEDFASSTVEDDADLDLNF